MNNSASILLIGNEGSFCKFIHNYLVKTGHPALVIYLKSDFDDIESINNKISYILNSTHFFNICF